MPETSGTLSAAGPWLRNHMIERCRHALMRTAMRGAAKCRGWSDVHGTLTHRHPSHAQAACTAAATRTLWRCCAASPGCMTRVVQRSRLQTAAQTLLSRTQRGSCSTGRCAHLCPTAAQLRDT